MVDQSLIEYVKRLNAKGYSSVSIRNQLVDIGYNPFEVSKVINLVDKPKIKKSNLYAKILLSLSLLIILLASIYLFWPSEVNIIEFNTKIVNDKVEQGGNLLFFNNIISDSKKEILASLEHKVVDDKGSVFIIKKESVLFPEFISLQTDIALFSTMHVGSYFVETILSDDKTSFKSRLSFSIIEKKNDFGIILTSNNILQISDCPITCNDFNSCTDDKCVNGNCVFEPRNDCCGNNICEASESESSCLDDCKPRKTQTSDDLKNLAKDNIAKGIEKAAKYCNQITDLYIRNECFLELVKESKDSIFCSSISDNELRDACLIDVILNKKDYSLCNKILDELLRNNCLLMGKVDIDGK